MKKCILCPRECGVDRKLRKGFCGAPEHLRAARAGLHYFEEPFLSGWRGSGTVFFSGCNLRCIYCQNYQISGNDSFGIEITTERLAEIFIEQQLRGAHNINLVTGTPYIPLIAEAIKAAKNGVNPRDFEGTGKAYGKGWEEIRLTIPVIWNSSGYEKAEMLEPLKGLVDIWLPDFKTLSAALGSRYMNAPDYPEYAKKSLAWMAEQAGEAEFISAREEETAGLQSLHDGFGRELNDRNNAENYAKQGGCDQNNAENHAEQSGYDQTNSPCYTKEDIEECGLMKRGVCVRHLVIPGQIEDSKNVLKYLYETYGNRIWISLMSQYTPMRTDFSAPELNRKLTAGEYDEVVDYAIGLGIEQCMIQGEDTADESFIPIFDGTGI